MKAQSDEDGPSGEPNIIQKGAGGAAKTPRKATKTGSVRPGETVEIARFGKTVAQAQRTDGKIDLQDPYRAFVVPTDANLGLTGKFATALFTNAFPSEEIRQKKISGFRGAVTSRLASLSPGTSALTPGVAVAHRDGVASLGIRTFIFATAFGTDGIATIENVAIAVRAILQLELDNSPSVAIPLLGAGIGGLTPADVARAMVHTIRKSPIHKSIEYIIILCSDDSSYRSAINSAREELLNPNARPQRALNDVPEGVDRLGIETEVKALTEMILLREMQPPLVVGVLGGWGSGKSFVFHLMETHIRNIRRKNIEAGAAWPAAKAADAKAAPLHPFVGHTYIIKFDAWTYAKSDLWASLMQKVFIELDEQLRVENALRKIKDAGGARKSLCETGGKWFDLTTCSREQQRVLLQQSGLAQEALDAGETDGLWETYKKLKLKKIDDLDNVKLQLKEKEKLEAEARTAAALAASEAAARRREAETKRQEITDQLKKQAEARVDEQMERESTPPELEAIRNACGKLGESVVQSIYQKLKIGGTHPLANPRKSFDEISGLAAKARWLWETRQMLPIGLFVISAGICISPALLANITSWWANFQMPAFLVSAVSMAGGAWEWFHKHKLAVEESYQSLSKVAEEVRAKNQKLRDELIQKELDVLLRQSDNRVAVGALESEVKKADDATAAKDERAKELADEGAKLRSKVEQLERELGEAVKFTSIADFVNNRIQAKDYNERLGLLHQVQSDIRELSECLTISGDDPAAVEKQKIFERGPARVVLFIDDLDRCPPESVVRVLEAAQLLVKTRLFVVVISMDLRYVTRALEKHYQDILVRNGDPSGLDYLEKIIQIPYRVRPVRPGTLGTYLNSQMTVKYDKKENQPATNLKADNAGAPAAANPAPANSSAPTAAAIDPQILESEIEFGEWEYTYLRECCATVEITPRSIKRIINVLKLIKIVWTRSGAVSEEAERIVIWLLVMSAAFPVEVNLVLNEILDILPGDGTESTDPRAGDPLNDIVHSTAEKNADHPGAARWDLLLKCTEILDSDMSLSEVDERTIDLLRSFSFLGSIGRDAVAPPARPAPAFAEPEAAPPPNDYKSMA